VAQRFLVVEVEALYEQLDAAAAHRVDPGLGLLDLESAALGRAVDKVLGPAVLLVVTALVRKLILDADTSGIVDAIRKGEYYHMQTFNQSLVKLFNEGLVKLEDALEAATNPEELMLAIRGIESQAPSL